MSQKGRFCLRKEGFIFLYKMIFCLRKEDFFSTKGRFYLRKEGFIIVYIVVLPYICYKINKLLNEVFCLRKEGLVYEMESSHLLD